MNPLARQLVKCSRYNESIGFYSHKTHRIQKCESRKELYACLLREFDYNIKSYLTQPQSFGYKVDGKTRRYTPDALIETSDGDFYYEEVKPESVLKDPELLKKYQYLKEVFDSQIKFPLYLTGIDEQGEDLTIKNLEYLYPFLQQSLDETEAELLIKNLEHQVTVRELIKYCKAKKKLPQYAMQLVANGYCSFPSHEFLNSGSILEVNHV